MTEYCHRLVLPVRMCLAERIWLTQTEELAYTSTTVLRRLTQRMVVLRSQRTNLSLAAVNSRQGSTRPEAYEQLRRFLANMGNPDIVLAFAMWTKSA